MISESSSWKSGEEMLEMASDWDKSPVTGGFSLFSSVIGVSRTLSPGSPPDDDEEDMTDDETDVGDAGESGRAGEILLDDDVVRELEDSEWGALYVHTIRWSSVSLSCLQRKHYKYNNIHFVEG